MLELDIRVCRGKKKCVGAGTSGGGPLWAHEAGGVPRGWARPGPSWPGACSPWGVSSAKFFSNILEKIIFHFQGIWRTFIFGVFLYCTDKLENTQKNTIISLFSELLVQ